MLDIVTLALVSLTTGVSLAGLVLVVLVLRVIDHRDTGAGGDGLEDAVRRHPSWRRRRGIGRQRPGGEG